MSIVVIGVNHATASLAIREKVYFALEALPFYLQDLLYHGYANEAVLLSTCNRSELYCDAPDAALVREWFYAQTMLAPADIEPVTYLYQDEMAVAHIMEVACGLNSMVLGEPQILGQMKNAFSESCAVGAIGALFHRLFQQVFMVAKEIRTTTSIGACPVSVASAAVHFAKQRLNTFADLQVALIGAGETTELLMRYLHPILSKPMDVVNRSAEKALTLINRFGGNLYDFNSLVSVLSNADLVFTATGSPLPIINQAIMTEVMHNRKHRPILIIDLAVPRDVDPAIEVDELDLYCIDDLKNIIERNRQGREHAADKAREMIRNKSIAFMKEMTTFNKVTQVIRAYRGKMEDLCQIELNKAKQLLHQGNDALDVLDAFAKSYTKKLLHVPSVQLRQAGVEGQFDLLRFAKQLFAIPDQEADETIYPNQIATIDDTV